MKILISIVTNNTDFYKQAAQLLPNEIGYEHLFSSNDYSHSKMIVTDGSDESVFDEDVPTFVIAEVLPKNVRESVSLRFYKRGDFSPEIFAKDILEWAEIINALEDTSKEMRHAKKKEFSAKEKLADYEMSLQMASELQKNVMMPNAPSSFDIAIHYQPAAKISGDILLVEEIGNKIFVIIGDVTDHGYLAGMYGASLYSLIKGYLSLASPFEMTLEGLVRYVQYSSSFFQPEGYGPLRQKTSATMLFCEIDKKEQTAHFINCGHGNEAPVATDNQGNAYLVPFSSEAMLPVIGDFTVVPPTEITEIPFVPGNCLVLYTDGITEVFKDPQKKNSADEYSSERLLSSVSYEIQKKDWTAASVLEGIRKDAESYCLSNELTQNNLDDILDGATDDVTVVVLKWI